MPRPSRPHQAAAAAAIITAAIAAPLTGPAAARPVLEAASSTSYCEHGVMADGTWTRPRSAASNRHRLGTRITLTSPGPGGLRRWVIRDRIGWGSDLDLWQPTCSGAIHWGRRHLTYRIGWRTRRHGHR